MNNEQQQVSATSEVRGPEQQAAPAMQRRNTRRALLSAAGLVAAPIALGKLSLAGSQRAGAGTRTLITIFLRGALDGLSLCAPANDATYQALRDVNQRIPLPGSNGVQALDSTWALSAGGSGFWEPYSNGDLAFVQGCGVPHGVRSHFEAQSVYELMNPDRLPLPEEDGAIARLLKKTAGTGGLRALAIQKLMPRFLLDAPKGLAIADPRDYDLSGDPATLNLRRQALDAEYSATSDPLRAAGLDSLGAIDILNNVVFDDSQLPTYPPSEFGEQMHNLAQLILANFGLQAAEVDYGGWDDHIDAGPLTGNLHLRLDDLSRAVRAFYNELKNTVASDKYTLMIVSEFGRRVAFNASDGMDHGSGNAMIVMGEGVNGGQVFTENWTGLQIDSQGDMLMNLDARDVWCEVMVKHFGLSSGDIDSVFPGYVYNPRNIVV